MFLSKQSEENLELQSTKNELTLQELLIRIDGLDRQVKAFMDELQVTPQQINVFVNDPKNFTKENWDELERQRKMLDEKLDLELRHIRDPKTVKKNLEIQKEVQRHWIFVR